MPFKNAGPYLENCLASIVSQNYRHWELIAVDDHSTDHSLAVAKCFSQQYGKVTIATNKGYGIIDALQTGYSLSQGTYITRMDADDLMSPDKLSLMTEALDKHGLQNIAIGLVSYFSEAPLGEGYKKYSSWLNDLTKTKRNYNEIYKECSIPSPNWMVLRSDFEKCGGFQKNTYPEDYDLAFRFRALGLNIIPILSVTHYWRDHASRASRNDPNYLDNRFTEIKIKHFLISDHRPKEALIVWGAGKKGKKIAKELILHEVPFMWLTNNSNKIGQNIYGKVLQDQEKMSQIERGQVIVSITSGVEKIEVDKRMTESSNLSFYRFS